jgi:iron(III) transport system ATP-binding protein
VSETPALEIRELSHHYGARPVLDGVSLAVAPGEFVAVLGESGCGKTTLLRSVAGLVTPSSGEIRLGGRAVASGGRSLVPVERRGVGLVFQEYALFPQMSVAENVGFGLPRAQRAARVPALLALAGLAGLGERRPAQLSGGQQQRAALVRALAPGPHLMLLDEPFSNVDAARRATLGAELRRVIAAEGAAAMLVTHDRDDALRLADRVFAVTPGPGGGSHIGQAAAPAEIYLRPVSAAVARLTGAAWFLEGEGRGEVAETPLGRVRLCEGREGAVSLVVRPEQAGFEEDAEGPDRVVERFFLGRGWALTCETAAGEVSVEVARPPEGARGRVVLPGAIWALPG